MRQIKPLGQKHHGDKTLALSYAAAGSHRAVIFVAMLGVLLSSCVMPDITTGGDLKPSSQPFTVDNAASHDDMSRLGASQHPRILATYGGEYHDAKLERMVAKIVGQLVAVSNNPNQTYRITILNSPNVNAFALPGGYVYITRGMLALANDSAEVAAVIAHEMSHVTANHGILRQQKEQEVELSHQVMTDVLSDQSATQESVLRGRLRLAQFSRNQELQADENGIKMLGQAGLDPFASPRFLQSMEDYTAFRSVSGATDASLDFLATHPSTPRRIQLAIAQARKVSAPGVGATDRNSFLNGINGMIFGDTADEGYVRNNQFIHPKMGIAFTVPQNFTIDNSKDAVIASGPDDLAIRFDAVTMPANQSAVGYITSGWVSGLQSESVESITVNGLPAARATAFNDKWQFDVVVIVAKNRVYRFLTAAPRNSISLNAISTATVNSFRTLSPSQVKNLRPLRIQVLMVKAGDTVASLAQNMQGTNEKERLFRIINALAPTDVLSAGQLVKIISE